MRRRRLQRLRRRPRQLGDRQEPVTITLWHPGPGARTKLFEQRSSDFQTKYPWITVKTIGFPNSDTFDQQIVIKPINAGNPPDALLSFGPDYVGQYCVQRPVDRPQALHGARRHRASTTSPRPRSATRNFDGKQCALPSLTDAYGLYYNKDMFAKAGITEPAKDA